MVGLYQATDKSAVIRPDIFRRCGMGQWLQTSSEMDIFWSLGLPPCDKYLIHQKHDSLQHLQNYFICVLLTLGLCLLVSSADNVCKQFGSRLAL